MTVTEYIFVAFLTIGSYILAAILINMIANLCERYRNKRG